MAAGAGFETLISAIEVLARKSLDIRRQYEKRRATCNCSTVDLGEISRAFLWETYGRKVRAGPECMQATRGHLYNALGWLPGARAGGFQPVI